MTKRVTLWGETLPDNMHEALKYVIEKLHQKYMWKPLYHETTYHNRHFKLIMYDPEYQIKRKIYVIYQRKPFMKFREYFNYDDVAQTINCEALIKIIRENYDFIIWVDENGNLYLASPIKVWKHVIENKWIRKTRETNEETCHIPRKLLYKL